MKERENGIMDMQKEKLKQMLITERKKIEGCKQIAKVHSAYISILLKRLGATEDNPVTITKIEIKEALERYESRGIPLEDGYSLYCEVVDNGESDAVQTKIKNTKGKKEN